MQIPYSMQRLGATIFRAGSVTYYYSSLFFPKSVRDDVFLFYAFVRTADDFVDQIPQDQTGFAQFRTETEAALQRGSSENPIIEGLLIVMKNRQIPDQIISAFLDAMEQDLTVSRYDQYRDLEGYMYGSAEVIGLVMAHILDLPEESYLTARLQGKAMQLINFIRDIEEDRALQRQYIPTEDLDRFGITSLDQDKQIDPEAFGNLVRFEIDRFFTIQQEAQKGYVYLPRTYRIPIETAAAMYIWTANRIYANPMIVFTEKVKPSPLRVVTTALQKSFQSLI